jgi:D-aminoacyl-tRNA deacylase
MNIAIIIYNKDPAGMNIKSHLDNIKFPNHINVHVITTQHILANNLDEEIDADLFIFATTHKSTANKKTLCVHPIGIYNDCVSLGGKAKSLVPTIPLLIRNLFLEMNNLKKKFILKGHNILDEFDISLEQTHHGPYLKKPALFIEIGSTDEEWTTKEAGNLIATALFNVLSKFNLSQLISKSKNACVIGGGHYNQVANKLLEKTDYAIGHIASKYYIETLDDDLIKQMAECSNTNFFIFDWKSCGKGKHRVVEIIEKLGYNWKKSKNIFNK